MDRSVLKHRGKRLKAQTPFGDIQYRPAVIPFQLQERKFLRHLSQFPATIEIYVPHVHVG